MCVLYRFEGELTEKQILKFISAYEKNNKSRYEKFQNYYKNKTDILSREPRISGDSNNKVASAFSGYIVDMSTGYFIGKPIVYSNAGEEKNDIREVIQDIYNYNDEADENMEIAKQCSIKGRCYEIVYLDETDQDENGNLRLRFNKIDAESMMVLYDYNISPEPSYAIRWYYQYIDSKKQMYVEVYSKESILYYRKEGSALVEDKPPVAHFFRLVPVIEYMNNEERQGDFEKVITTIDAYDKALSDSVNNLEYFANAYMYLVGMASTDEVDIKKMRELRVMLLEKAGEAGFLTKPDNSAETENLSNRLDNDIHKFSMIPNLSDENFANNSSGVAMMYKLFGLEQLASKKERKFKKGLQRRLELIVNYLNFRGKNYDYRDIGMKFTRNIPVDNKENVEIVQMLQGIVSKETAISNLKLIEDVSAELEKIQSEKNQYSLDLDGDSYES